MVVRDISRITELYRGAHRADSEQLCLMEAVAYAAGEPWSDHPNCVSPVLAAFGRVWNDSMRSNQERAELLPYIPLLINTPSTLEVDLYRSYMALNWLVRVFTLRWLRLAGLSDSATTLEQLPPLLKRQTIRESLPVVVAVRAAVRNATWDAAIYAVRDAARDAARAAAMDAAREETMDAAREETMDMVRDAIWDASVTIAKGVGERALEPTVQVLKQDAHRLFHAMIAYTG